MQQTSEGGAYGVTRKLTEVFFVRDDSGRFLKWPDGDKYMVYGEFIAEARAWAENEDPEPHNVPAGKWKKFSYPGDIETQPQSPPPEWAPVNVITELATNHDATWPFPQLKANPDPPRALDTIKHITIHHSAGERATTNLEYWHRLHTQTKSWSRCGYHLAIAGLTSGADIELYEVNPPEWVSWHDTVNYSTYAVTFAGDLRAGHDVEPNEVQLACFGRAMAYILPKLPALESIVPHKFWQATACPGDIERWYPLLVDAAQAYGHDIGGLLRFTQTRRARFVQAFGGRQYGPPVESYEEV